MCYIDYAYGDDGTLARLMEYNNAIRQRVPYVLNVMVNFIIKLKEFNLIRSMESITAAGFCLGKIKINIELSWKKIIIVLLKGATWLVCLPDRSDHISRNQSEWF